MSSAPSPGWPPASTTAPAAPGRCPPWTSGGRSNGRAGSPGTGCWSRCTSRTCRLFADSDSRASYGYRIITGAYTASLWRMTFGFAPPIEWDARIKGRGVVGIGEASSLIHHAQIAWLPAAERRRYALTGPPPPDWHTDMRPGPVDHAPCAGRGPQARRRLPRHHPRQPGARPCRCPCPARTAGTPASGNTVRCPALGHHRGQLGSPAGTADGGDDLITGIAAAAGYLGYGKPDSFRRARTRHPIPGETRTSDGRPAWTPAALRAWHAQRNPGNRTVGGDPG